LVQFDDLCAAEPDAAGELEQGAGLGGGEVPVEQRLVEQVEVGVRVAVAGAGQLCDQPGKEVRGRLLGPSAPYRAYRCRGQRRPCRAGGDGEQVRPWGWLTCAA